MTIEINGEDELIQIAEQNGWTINFDNDGDVLEVIDDKGNTRYTYHRDGTLETPALSTDDQTINQSVTWPDGSTTTTSPGGAGLAGDPNDIVVVSQSGKTTVDPSSDARPIQAAADTAADNNEEYYLILPPGEITTDPPILNVDKHFRGCIGQGMGFGEDSGGYDNTGDSSGGFTNITLNSDGDGFVFDEGTSKDTWPRGFVIRDFNILGAGGSPPTGKAFHYVSGRPYGFTVTHVYAQKLGAFSYVDQISGADPWQAKYGQIHFEDIDPGGLSDQFAIKFDRNNVRNPMFRIDYVGGWITDLGSGVRGGVVDSGWGNLEIGFMNLGGTDTGVAVQGNDKQTSATRVGGINYELNADQSTAIAAICRSGRERNFEVGRLRVSGSANINANYAYVDQDGYHGGNYYGPVIGKDTQSESSSFNNNVLNCTAPLDDVIWYAGTYDEIDYNVDSSYFDSRKYINPLGSKGYPLAELTGQTLTAGSSNTFDLGFGPSDYPSIHPGDIVVEVTNDGSISSNYGVSVDKVYHDEAAGSWVAQITETETPSTNPSVDIRAFPR